jgi:propanediol dehydratase small subunit
MKRCTYCGKEHDDTATVCVVDGESLIKVFPSPEVQWRYRFPSVSLLRIIVGVVGGACFFGICMAVVWYLSLPLPLAFLALCLGAGSAACLVANAQRRQALVRYWTRACMGIRWRRRFPEAPKPEIREFLDIFTDAFGFSRARRCYFSPDDRVLEVYRALYPDRFMADYMELETLESRLRQRYGIDMQGFWREDITLGEVFSFTKAA